MEKSSVNPYTVELQSMEEAAKATYSYSERPTVMYNVVTMSQELMTKLQQETDLVMSDRLLTRDVLEARLAELARKRDEEMTRVEQWANQQKKLITEIFSAMIAEHEADRLRNEENMARMKGEKAHAQPAPAKPVRQLRVAAE